jgi:hypothetical protein
MDAVEKTLRATGDPQFTISIPGGDSDVPRSLKLTLRVAPIRMITSDRQ